MPTLTNPLGTLVSPDKARVLTVLYRAGQPLTGRTIASLTGSVSQPTVSRLLLAFFASGLVDKVPGGYVLNREHLAYRALESLLEARSEFDRRVVASVAQWRHKPVSIVLFGSTARNAAGPSSDIDLLVVRPQRVGNDDAMWAGDVAHLVDQVHAWTGAPCEVLEYDEVELDELARHGDPLVEALQHDGDTLVGRAVREIIRASDT